MFKTFIPLIFLLSLAITAIARDAAPPVHYAPGRVIIKLKSGVSPSTVAQQLGAGSIEPVFSQIDLRSRSPIRLQDFYIAKINESRDALEVAREISRSEAVEYAQPDYLHQVHAIPNDPDFSSQPFWNQISAPQAWDITQGDSSVIIAILDTGVDWDHPDLAADIWTNEGEIPDDGIDNDGNGKVDDVHGWDFVNNASSVANGEDGDEEDNDPSDYNGHGTHVAGLAAAVTNNGIGVAGGGWNCEIMPLRVGYETKDGTGSILTSAVLKAIQYAVYHGAAVMNASFGGPFDDFAELDIMRYAFAHDVVVVKAAGNSNSDIGYSPDNEDFVLSAASVKSNDQKAGYSNYGEWVKISAPGGNRGIGLRSTYPDDRYSSIWGTSMASPVVAGIAGLVKSVHPDWSAAEIVMHLVDTADNIDAVNPKYAGLLGKKGRVNAYNAVSRPFSSQPEFEIARVSIQDLLHGANGDQRVNIGETADILVRLTNRWNDATNVFVELTTTDPFVTIDQGSASFESIPGISAKRNYAENLLDMFAISVDSSAFPHNIKFQLHISADGGFSQTLDFQIALEARVLFVDDDDGVHNVEQYYFDVLDSLGMPYDVWDYATQGRIGSVLRRYDLVIWSCENAKPTLNNEDRSDLQSYLRTFHDLFISGQNIAWDLAAQQTQEEAQAMNYYNQNYLSSGKSKTFYENWLHARYKNDKSSYSFVQGVDGEQISQGLEFAVAEPMREVADQSPDVISPGNNADAVFKYPDKTVAAIRHDTGAKIVNFAFGGIEAITDEEDRYEVMRRLLNYFTGMELVVLGVDNVENTSGDFIVRAALKTDEQVDNVKLYWRKTEDAAFNQVAMTAIDDTLYTASIPRQPAGTQLEYAVQAVRSDGLYTPVQHGFLIVEATAPEIAAIMPRTSNLNRRPLVRMQATDNSGLDSTSAKVIFWTSSSGPDSLDLTWEGNGTFSGTITGNFLFGDSLFYQFAVQDNSPAHVRGLSPVYSMLLGFEDFESGLDAWEVTEGEWGLNSVKARSGQYSIHESGESTDFYPVNANRSITLKEGLDLSQFSQATLSLWTMYDFAINDKDFGQVEASSDSGETWMPLGLPIDGAAATFYNAQFSLDEFTGPGNENVLLRFRLVSNDNKAGPGWFIDDISILPVRTNIAKQEAELPLEFRLEDNYPNPFNNGTTIRFALQRDATVNITVYNTLGQKIKTLTDQMMTAGVHTLIWDGSNNDDAPAPSGLYFCKMVAGDYAAVKKLTLTK